MRTVIIFFRTRGCCFALIPCLLISRCSLSKIWQVKFSLFFWDVGVKAIFIPDQDQEENEPEGTPC